MTENKEPAIMTTDRLFGEKVWVPPSKERQTEGRTNKEVYDRMYLFSSHEDWADKFKAALKDWMWENKREASIMAFEGDRVLCRLGNKLEWFYLAEVELAGVKPLSN